MLLQRVGFSRSARFFFATADGGNKRAKMHRAYVSIAGMAVEHIVSLLIAERDRLDRAIEILQGPIKKRGRPARGRSLSSGTSKGHSIVESWPMDAGPVKKKAAWSAAKRQAQAERMKAYWAKRKKTNK